MGFSIYRNWGNAVIKFRVRTILFLLTLISLTAIYYKIVRIDGMAQYESVQWLKRKKYWFRYDFQFDANGKLNGKEVPDYIPKFLLDCFGIDSFCSVVDVQIYDRKFDTIEPIRGLKNLKRLNLSMTSVKDLGPLKDMIHLEELKLTFAKNCNVKPIRRLKNLRSLNLNGTKVGDVRLLEDLTNLEELDLSGSKVSELRVISNCKQLRKLKIGYNSIDDFSFLLDLKNLEYLDAGHSNLTDYKILEKTNLKSLRINGCEISDLSVFPRMDQLEEFWIAATKVSDLSQLAQKTPNLKSLNINQTAIRDLTPLGKLPNLQILLFQGTVVQDISPLRNLRNLTYVTLPETVRDLEPISNWTEIEYLKYPVDFLIDLSILKRLTKLKRVEIFGGKEIVGFEHLKNLEALEYLGIRSPGFNDLSVLKGLSNLKELYLGYCKIDDLSPLETMPSLEVVHINWFVGKDFSVLTSMKKLEILGIWSPNLDARAIHQISEALPDTEIKSDKRVMAEAKKIYGKWPSRSAYKKKRMSYSFPPPGMKW